MLLTRRPLALVDTNTLFQMAISFERSPLFVAWREDQFKLVLSEELLGELMRVSDRPHLRRYLPASRAVRFIALMRADAVLVEPATDSTLPRCRDAKDDMVIATAVAARADFIVTIDGDLHKLPLVACLRDEWNIRVVYPFDFLRLLTA